MCGLWGVVRHLGLCAVAAMVENGTEGPVVPRGHESNLPVPTQYSPATIPRFFLHSRNGNFLYFLRRLPALLYIPQVLPVLACAKVTCRAHITSPGDDHVTQRILAEVHVATPRVPGLVPLSQWLQERWPACRVEEEAPAAAGQALAQAPSHGQGQGAAQGQAHIQVQAQGPQPRQQQQQQQQHVQPPQTTSAAAAGSSRAATAAASHASGTATHAQAHAPAAARPPPPTPLPTSQRHPAAVPAPAAAAAPAPVPAAPPLPLPLPPKATAAMALHGLEPAVGLTGPPPPPPALLAQRGLSSTASHAARAESPPQSVGKAAPQPRSVGGGDGSSLKDGSGAPTASRLPTVAGGIACIAPEAAAGAAVAAQRAGAGLLGSSDSAASVPDLGLAAGAVPSAASGAADTRPQPVAEGTQPQSEAAGHGITRGVGASTSAGSGGLTPGRGPGVCPPGPGQGSQQSGAAAFGCFGCFSGGQGLGHDSDGSGPVAVGPAGSGAKNAAAGVRALGPAGPARPVPAGVAAGPLAPSGRAVLPPAVSRRLLAPAADTGSGTATGGGGAAAGGSGARPYGRAALPLPPPPPLQPLLPVTEAMDVLICLAEVLGALHRRGLTHGAVSPKTVQLQVTPPPPDIQALLKRPQRSRGRGNRHGREQAPAQPQLASTPEGQAQEQPQDAAAGHAVVQRAGADTKQLQQRGGEAAGAGPAPAQAVVGMAAAVSGAATTDPAQARPPGSAEALAGAVAADDSGAGAIPRQASTAESVATPTAHATASKPALSAAAAIPAGAGGPLSPTLQLTQVAQGSGPASSGGRGSVGSNGAAKPAASLHRPAMMESLADPAMAAFLDSGSTDPKSRQTLAQVVAALGGVPRANHRGGAAADGAGAADGAVGSSAAAGGSGMGGSMGGSGRTAMSASGPSGTGSALTTLLLGSAAVKSNASASETVMVTAALPSIMLDSAAAAAASASSARTQTGTGVLSSSEAPGAKQGQASPTPPSGSVGAGRASGACRRRSAVASPDAGGGGGGGSAAERGIASVGGERKAEAGGSTGRGELDMDADADDKSSTQSLQLRPIVPQPPPGQSASSVTTASLARPPPQPSVAPSPRDTQQSGLPSIAQSASTPLGSSPHASSGLPHSGPDTISQPGTSGPSQALSLPQSHGTTGLGRTTVTTPHETPTEGDDTLGSAGAAAAVAAGAVTAADTGTGRQRPAKPRRLVAMLTLPALGPAVLQMLTWGRARPVGLPRDHLLWCAPELLNTGALGWPILPFMPRRSGSGIAGAAGAGAGATGLDLLGPLDRSMGTMRSHRMGGSGHRGRERDKGGNVQFSGFLSGPGPGDGSYTYGAGLNSNMGGNRRFRLAAALLMGHDASGAASSMYGVSPSCDGGWRGPGAGE